jgi:pimeloyl-ACP methyl ester carboxylesterase
MSSWAITPARIEVRPIFSATVHSYDWSSVREIETGCTRGRSANIFQFVLNLGDSTRIDLMQLDELGFLAAYPKIQVALEGHSYGFSNGFVTSHCGYPGPGWQRILSQPPTDQHSAPTL